MCWLCPPAEVPISEQGGSDRGQRNIHVVDNHVLLLFPSVPVNFKPTGVREGLTSCLDLELEAPPTYPRVAASGFQGQLAAL